jgi:uncharacterized membrane protein YgcG
VCHHVRVLRRRACIAVVAALLFGCLGLIPAAGRALADTVSASVAGTPSGQRMGSGFVGVSFEYRAVHQYTGRDPLAVDPVLVHLLAGLAPGQSPVIRIGGDSTDASWWPIRNTIVPAGIYYPITPGWLRTTGALAQDLNAKLILGINLAAGRPAIAAAEGQALLAGIGRQHIAALEIGNEPDLYGVFAWYRRRNGAIVRSRGRGYNLSAYTQQFAQWSRVLPSGRDPIPLAGPAASGPAWMNGLRHFADTAPRLGLITLHRYPLRACTTSPTDPSFPSIPNLLADSASAGLAAPLDGYARTAHAHHDLFRVAEINSASCEGAKGVSDTFASALWALDTMFQFARAGVDGVNFHMLPGAAYELFTVSHSATGAWQAFVHPEYYGLDLFAQAFPPGAQLLPVSAPGGPVKVWATRGADGTVRLTLINKDAVSDHDVAVSISGQTAPGVEETLQAPGVSATDGVTLGGQTFGDETSTGQLPGPAQTTTVTPTGSTYTVTVPAASAAMVTIGGPGGSAGSGGSEGSGASGGSGGSGGGGLGGVGIPLPTP